MSSDAASPARLTEPRPSVEILLPDGRAIEGRRGSPLGSLLAPLADEAPPVVGGIVNGELRELSFPIEIDSRVRPVTMGEADGMRIYRRSLTLLLAAAFEELFPADRLTVDHSVASGGYYCQVRGRPPLSGDELARLEARMRELVAADLPIVKESVPLEQAIASFAAKGHHDKERLLAHRRKAHLVFYRLRGLRDYHFGYKVPGTGYLKWFGLARSGDGFTLRFPRRHRPDELLPLPDYPKLLAAFREYGDWLDALGIGGAGALNDALRAGRALEIVLVSEALHESRIAEIAAEVARRREEIRLILVAGPSASGKTTFSKRLAVQLLARGVSPVPVEMDGFFVDREKTPRDEAGEYDYESLQTLDLERLNRDLRGLIQGDEVHLPKYD
ncbi:MAG: nucleoside kinase, partial [Anaerolineales bacterium]